jgi:hypothetical protein
MQISSAGRTWQVDDADALRTALEWRDSRGGAEFWLAHQGGAYPWLALRLTASAADLHYFPAAGHPGFRCLGGAGLPAGGLTKLVYDGCDPADGEDVPNEFIVPAATAARLAEAFFRSGEKSPQAQWAEL